MKHKGNGGFSLIECLVAIVLLGAMVVPTCTALVMSIKINDKTDQMLQAQLAVSSAVEILMAEGIVEGTNYEEKFDNLTVEVEKEDEIDPFYTVTVSCEDISVTTQIRAAKEVADEEE